MQGFVWLCALVILRVGLQFKELAPVCDAEGAYTLSIANPGHVCARTAISARFLAALRMESRRAEMRKAEEEQTDSQI